MLSYIIIDQSINSCKRLEGLINKVGGFTNTGLINNPFEVMDKIHENHVDIIFVEVELQCLNGFDLIRAIQRIDKSVIIIITTSLSHYAVKAINIGVNGYLQKPIDFEDLKYLLSNIANKGKAQTSKNQIVRKDYIQ